MLNFPIQLIPESKKDERWHEKHIDIFSSTYGANLDTLIADKSEEFRLFNVYNGLINIAEKCNVTSPNGQAFPVEYKVWPLARQKCRQIIGEFTRRPLRTKVTTINKDAELRKEKHQLDLALNKALDVVNKELSEILGFDIETENPNLPIPDDIDKYMRMTYKEAVEDGLQIGINYLLFAKKLVEQFKIGLTDNLITFKSFFKIYILDGDPVWRRIDPRTCYYDLPFESEYLDDCAWFAEERWLTPNEILSEYNLTKEQILKLHTLTYNNTIGASSQWLNYKPGVGWKIRVVSMEWKSQKEVRVKVSENKYDKTKPFYKIVKDTYKARGKKEHIESRVIDDVRKCTKIGGEIITDWGRLENQVRSIDRPERTTLSYVGLVGDATTDIQHSLVKELEYLQDFASDILYHIRLAMSRMGSRAIVYDVAQIPKQFAAHGNQALQKVIHHMKQDGIIPINSKDEANNGKPHPFNQFTQVDLSLQGVIQELINTLALVEDLAAKVSGISPQREGQTMQYEAASNTQRSVIQSTARTEVYLKPYEGLISRVLEKALNLMKIAWGDGKKARFFMGDGGMQVLNVLPDVALNDYAIYMNDGGKDLQNKEKIDNLALTYMNGVQDPEMILQMIKVFKAETADESETILEAGLEKMKQLQDMMREQQAQADQAQAQAEAEDKAEERAVKREDIQAKIQVAQINAKAKTDVADLYSDDLRDTEKAKLSSKAILEDKKIDKMQEAKQNSKNASKQ